MDGRSDLYSLACVLQECLTGEPPFRRPSELATLFAHLEEEPSAAPGLDQVMRTGLAKSPDDRLQSGRELVEAARGALGLEPKRQRWPLAVAAAGLALLAVALLAFFLTRSGAAAPTAGSGRLLRIDPVSNRVAGEIAIGAGPTGVAVGSGRVWAASYRDGNGTLWLYDGGRRAQQAAPVGRPFGLVIHDGETYVVANGRDPSKEIVTLYDATTGDQLGGSNPRPVCSLSGGSSGVWAAGCPNAQELHVVAGTPQTVRFGKPVEIPLVRPLGAATFREALSGMAQGEESVWVIGDADDQRLWRIDPVRHRIAATIELGFPPGGVAVGGGRVWITDELRDRLVEIDPATNTITGSIKVGRGALGVAFGLGRVWVANAIDHTVMRVDPFGERVEETVPVPATPHSIAVGDGAVWVVGDAR